MKKLTFLALVIALSCSGLRAQQFKVSYPDSLLNQSFTGYVFLYLSTENKSPKDGMVGLNIFPCFSKFVKNVRPGQPVTIGDDALAYPAPLSDITRGEYYVQAVWDRNLGGRAISESPGNLYSETQKVSLTKDYSKQFEIVATRVIPEPVFKETKYVKEVKAPSTLLSQFLHRPVSVNAAVQLPKQYFDEPTRKFPVEFIVFGYGGDYHRFSGNNNEARPIDTTSCIIVYLDGNCQQGHSVYANSDNNGPWGDALTKEFIPYLEKSYRCNGAYLLSGHSSGGWSVLWLQTHYPKVFAGCWSSSPDPVDFTSFQKVNLYTASNFYYTKDSVLNQCGTIAGFFPWFSQKQVGQMENVIYRGEQMHSFNAVFSKRGDNGLPQILWDAKTGVIDHSVFEHWKGYDINAYLKENWQQLRPDLEGKVRVSVGEGDNFLLNYAVVLLDTAMTAIHSKFEFGYYPGDHFTVQTPQYRKDGSLFLSRRYQQWKAEHSKDQ